VGVGKVAMMSVSAGLHREVEHSGA
jgi:hypothetical protein